MSLRRRLTLLTIGAFAIGLIVLGFVVPRLVENSLTDRLDDELPRASGFAAFAMNPDFERPARPGRDADGRRTSTLEETYAEFRNPDGTLVSGEFLNPDLGDRSIPDLPAVLDVAIEKPFTVDGAGNLAPERWRVEVFTLVDRSGVAAGLLVVAVPMTSVDDTVSQVVRIALWTSAVTLVGLGILSWWLIGLGLRPLKKMERSAAKIAIADDLGRRVEHPPASTEIGQLGATLNHMLERLEESFLAQRATETRLRQFAADASHELRTPLTSILGYAEFYRRGGDGAEQVARSMGRIEEEGGRMNRLVEDLLLLARSHEGSTLAVDDVDVTGIVGDLVDDLRVVEPNRQISFTAEPVTMPGDEHRLSQAVANLLTNARMHTPSGTPIDVIVRCVNDADGTEHAEIVVVDHGPGLQPGDIEHIFDRFYRADRSRSRSDGSGGSGLGLSITDAISRAHGGSVTASATPGGGATFTISLPVT